MKSVRIVGSLVRVSTAKHGIDWLEGDGLEWPQYWKGVEHVWYWQGIPVWWRMRKRDRPMYEFIKQMV